MSSLSADWLNPKPWVSIARSARNGDVMRALAAESPGITELATLLSPAANGALEDMAAKARQLTRHRFGHTISLYVPLYLSDYCSGGCAYCGFAANRQRTRHRLERPEIIAEMDTLKGMGFQEILLLTGDRTPRADFDYLREAVALASKKFHLVTIEVFPMQTDEYRGLVSAGCTGMTVYQETYDPDTYPKMHPSGPKRDYRYRLATPARALDAGLRTVGLGALLGLADPLYDAIALFQHLQFLRTTFWRAGFSVSFPRIRPQLGSFIPPYPVGDRLMAQIIYAFRICLPDVPLILSTRENAAFRDGMAGIGISKMSIASRTTVGGYRDESANSNGQFEIEDRRSIETFCAALKSKGLEPVFKNWDTAYRDTVVTV